MGWRWTEGCSSDEDSDLRVAMPVSPVAIAAGSGALGKRGAGAVNA